MQKSYNNLKIILLASLLLWTIITWVITPPYYKIQHVKITHIEENYRKSGFNTEYLREIYYEYTLPNNNIINGKFLSNKLPFEEVGKYIDYNVITPSKYGGELNLLTTSSLFLFLFFSFYFMLIFIFHKIKNQIKINFDRFKKDDS